MKACTFVAFLAVAAAAAPKSHYGDPLDGCMPDEIKVEVGGVPGAFCSPKCDSNSSCPTDLPQGVTAKPKCSMDSGKGYCYLDCASDTIGDHCAGPDATCKYSEYARMCTYDEKKPPQPSDSHYTDPKYGCRPDEEKMKLAGVPGGFCAPKCDLNSSTPTCPTDVPQGVTAKTVCSQDSGKGYCFLDCGSDSIGQPCGYGATCKYSEFAHVCTYDEWPPAPPHHPHYGNPKDGCKSDEVVMQVPGFSGTFCSPKCSSNSSCPTDVPQGVTATPLCSQDSGKGYCYLNCNKDSVGQPCGYSATCKYSEFAHVCTYDEWPPAPPHHPHYGNPKDGCKSDEVVMQVPGISGNFCSPKCSSNSSCPTDVPFGMTPTKPECSDQGEGFCFLSCIPNLPWGDQCDANEGNVASCQETKYGWMCAYYDNDGRDILV